MPPKGLIHPNRKYQKEYADYYGAPGKTEEWTPEQKAHRKDKLGRSNARRKLCSLFPASKLKGMDVDHKNCNPQDNRLSNLVLRPINSNRDGSVCKAIRKRKKKS